MMYVAVNLEKIYNSLFVKHKTKVQQLCKLYVSGDGLMGLLMNSGSM